MDYAQGVCHFKEQGSYISLGTSLIYFNSPVV
jgi:hypothetical protein